MTMRQRILTVGFWAMAIAVAFVVMVVIADAIETPTTDPNPAETAGSFAPIVALCTAFMALSQARSGRSLRIWPRPDIYIGVSSVICAYLWIMDEAGKHLFDPEFPIVLSSLFAILAVGAFLIFYSTQEDSTQSVNRQPSENGDNQ